ncbi:MAG: C40 family peptidase, partial [Deltaproteobacteria bacterium]|nr:C40 family peptidase [Deltaproteobacteria bacterium]
QHSITVPRTAQEQVAAGTGIKSNDLRPGDLVLYWHNRAARSIHVGLYTGGGKYIHCSNASGRVEEASTGEIYQKNRFIEARRVLDDPTAAPLPQAQKESVMKQAEAVFGPTRSEMKPSTSAVMVASAEPALAATADSQASSVEAAVAKVQAQKAQNAAAPMANKANTYRRITAPTVQTAAPRQPANLSGRITRGAAPQAANKNIKPSKNYQTKPGDTIYNVAQRFGVTPSSLLQANHLNSAQLLRTGHTLSIP